MANSAHITESTPTVALNGVQVGDLWLRPSTRMLSICYQVDPSVQFMEIIRGGVPTVTVSNVPAGGTGAAAGAWDTSGNRDTAITNINALMAALRQKGVIA